VIYETFRWSNAFTYNIDNENNIAANPANVDLVTNDTLRFAPGQLYNLNVSIADDVGVYTT